MMKAMKNSTKIIVSGFISSFFLACGMTKAAEHMETYTGSAYSIAEQTDVNQSLPCHVERIKQSLPCHVERIKQSLPCHVERIK